MDKKFGWAVNDLKLQRAIKIVNTAGKELSDENVKAEYVKIAGLVRGENEVSDEAEDIETVDETPKKRGRKAKTDEFEKTLS